MTLRNDVLIISRNTMISLHCTTRMFWTMSCRIRKSMFPCYTTFRRIPFRNIIMTGTRLRWKKKWTLADLRLSISPHLQSHGSFSRIRDLSTNFGTDTRTFHCGGTYQTSCRKRNRSIISSNAIFYGRSAYIFQSQGLSVQSGFNRQFPVQLIYIFNFRKDDNKRKVNELTSWREVSLSLRKKN